MQVSDESYGVIERLAATLALLQRGPATARKIVEEREHHRRLATEGDLRRTARDIAALQRLGFQIERHSKPIVYTLRGYPPPPFSAEELQTLALIRDAFVNLSSHAEAVQHLLSRLTDSLSEQQRATYNKRPAFRLPLHTAIDYRPYDKVIRLLEHAIAQRQQIAFDYHPLAGPGIVHHERLDPYEIEYLRNHFYLIAYSYRSLYVQEFRIDRIVQNERSPENLHTQAPPKRKRKLIPFTYRLPARFIEHGVSERFEILGYEKKQEPDGEWAYIRAQWWSDFWIIRTLLAYAENVVIIEPTWLKEIYIQTVEDMLPHSKKNL
jgi:predicted DNA-binding transcriptional regulator YafY